MHFDRHPLWTIVIRMIGELTNKTPSLLFYCFFWHIQKDKIFAMCALGAKIGMDVGNKKSQGSRQNLQKYLFISTVGDPSDPTSIHVHVCYFRILFPLSTCHILLISHHLIILSDHHHHHHLIIRSGKISLCTLHSRPVASSTIRPLPLKSSGPQPPPELQKVI